ncbi:MAG TPA: efflux RND transporter periplasmic adaptor subunit [Acidobacteriota bacterium]|nr:efflux RND transporter periplasmic adaptor subunit [Acidobacteriota bacterium]
MSYYEHISELPVASAAPLSTDALMPGLRPDVVVRRFAHEGEVYYVIKDPLLQAYYRFAPEQYEIIELFDGTRTAQGIADAYNRLHPNEAIDADAVLEHRQSLKDMDLLSIPAVEKSLQFMERLKEQRKNRAKTSKFKNLFEMTFSAWDPDEAFNRIIPYIRFLYTKPFFVISFTAILMMAVVNFIKWEEFKQGTIALYTFTDKSLWEILVFVILMTTTGTIHELGHGLTLKHFGGEVRQVGFLLFYLTPAFYCDVSDSYLLTSRKERLWVTFAGVYSELCLCSIATFVWFFAVPGSLIYNFAFQIILFTGISSFLINMNPLIKLDGYYALMDSLEIPELREEAFDHIGRRIKKLFGLKVDDVEGLTRRKKRIYWIYGIFAILYTLTLYLLIVFWLRNVYLKTFKGFGYVLLAGSVYFLFRKEIGQGYQFLKFVYLDKKELLMKKVKTKYTAAAIVILILLLIIPQTHMKISGPFEVKPVEQTEIRSEVDGFVRDVYVRENSAVKAGQKLAQLENPLLVQDSSRSSTEMVTLDRNVRMAQLAENPAELQKNLRMKQETAGRNNENQRKINQLLLLSPITGKVATPRVEEQTGEYLKRGDVFCRMIAVDRVKIEIPVREYYVPDLKKGQTVILKLDAYPTQTFEGKIDHVSPAIRERVEALTGTYTQFLATAIIANPEGKLLPGMRGDAKILAGEYSILGRVFRELRRWIQSRIW